MEAELSVGVGVGLGVRSRLQDTDPILGIEAPAPEPLLSLLSSPLWRDITWTSKNLDLIKQDIKTTAMPVDVPKPKILLCGPTGAGKSSFINSILSICKGRITVPLQAGCTDGSFSTRFVCVEDREIENFQLCDTMGLDMTSGKGIVLNDVFSLIGGHIRNGYEFNTARPIDDRSPSFVHNPERKDKVCCVVFVVPAMSILSGLPPAIIYQINEVLRVVKGRDMNTVVITKIDEVCDKTRDNISLVYQSPVLKQVKEKAAELFNMPVFNVHLVKNYVCEQDVDTDTSILLSQALMCCVKTAANYLKFQ